MLVKVGVSQGQRDESDDGWPSGCSEDSSVECRLRRESDPRPRGLHPVQSDDAYEHGTSVDLVRKHPIACKQTVHSTRVTDSLWTVRFDADRSSLIRTDVGDARDTSDAKRMRLMRQREETRKDQDDTVNRDAAQRFRETEKPSPSSSSAIPYQVEKPVSIILQHVERDAFVGMSASAADTAMKKRTNLDADVEINAIETLSDTKVKVKTAFELGERFAESGRPVNLAVSPTLQPKLQSSRV